MERDTYDWHAQNEDTYWWFAGRRRIAQHVLDQLELPANANILEAGCGGGSNLSLLSRYGTLYGFEPDDAYRTHAKHRNTGHVEPGRLPDAIPFAGTSFDLICMFDVLEHLDDDSAALASLHARLNPGGWLLVTVPAHPWLWNAHDIACHHKRRYRLGALAQLVENSGFSVRFASHMMCWLFPILLISRLKKQRSAHPPRLPKWANQLFARIYASERFTLQHVALPFGSSIILLAQKA